MAADKKGRRLWIRLLFAFYLAVLIYLLFFAEAMGRTEDAAFRYNLVPFREILRFIRYASHFSMVWVMINLFGNVAAFVPFGYFLPQMTKQRIGVIQTTVRAFLFSLIIECMQLLLHVGSFDVDDIILNTLGGAIGAICCILIHKKAWENYGK